MFDETLFDEVVSIEGLTEAQAKSLREIIEALLKRTNALELLKAADKQVQAAYNRYVSDMWR